MQETKRQKQKNITRKLILDTALLQFGKNGILNTKTADIAKAANVSHGTIFAHFSTQEDLLIAAVEEFGNRISKRLHELIDGTSGLYEVLQAHIRGLIEFEAFYTALIKERALLTDSITTTYIMIQSSISFHIGLAAEKEMRQLKVKNIPVHLLFNTWTALIHYYLTNKELFTSDDSILEKYAEELLQHYYNLIKI